MVPFGFGILAEGMARIPIFNCLRSFYRSIENIRQDPDHRFDKIDDVWRQDYIDICQDPDHGQDQNDRYMIAHFPIAFLPFLVTRSPAVGPLWRS